MELDSNDEAISDQKSPDGADGGKVIYMKNAIFYIIICLYQKAMYIKNIL